MSISLITTLVELNALVRDNPHKVVILDCFADWCGPCKELGEFLEALDLNPHYRHSLKIVKADIDQAKEIAKHYNVESIPYVVIYYGGRAYTDVRGCDKEKIKRTVSKLLKKNMSESQIFEPEPEPYRPPPQRHPYHQQLSSAERSQRLQHHQPRPQLGSAERGYRPQHAGHTQPGGVNPSAGHPRFVNYKSPSSR